jgi:hypothetical protein
MHSSNSLTFDSIDVDLPLEVDDEYWEHPNPNQAFVQPAGKPCRVSFFVASIKLHHIMSYAMRTIVSSFGCAWLRAAHSMLVLHTEAQDAPWPGGGAADGA